MTNINKQTIINLKIICQMKNLSLKYLLLLLCSVALITSCSNDDDDENKQDSPFVGDYVIKEAKTSEAFTINTNELGEIPIPAGTNITSAIQEALLSQVNCSSADNSWIELRNDFSIYMSCAGANELSAGTWDEVSATELRLNINADAVPSSPVGFTLTVTNIAVAGSDMSGLTSVPLPADMVATMVAPLTLSEDNPAIFLVSFSLTFTKQ